MANYTNMADLVATYVEAQEGTYLNVEATINDVPLMCDIYRVADETVLIPEILTGCTENDANTQIIVGKDMSVASETTFIPPYRCKGIFICDIGTFTNDGTISMTARGAVGEGKDILLHNTYMISATGGAGGASRSYYGAGKNKLNGDGGSTPSEGVLSCAGGGSGGIFYHTDTNKTVASGAGGRGTSFSGGAGGGGAVGIDNGATGGTGSSSGGAGGNHAAGGSGTYTMNSAGGAGNPAGSNYRNSISPAYDSNDGIGTGGLIVILASEIIGSGDFESKGSNARGFVSSYEQSATGGGSGGGCIALLARNIDLTGEYFVSGGAGGANGNGSGAAGGSGVYAEIEVSDLILVHIPFKAAITDKEHLPNVSPSNQARLLAMLDDDELYYEILGKRHRASTGHHIEDEEGNAVTKRDDLVVNSPLTVEDDSTNEKTVIGADTSGSLDFTQIVAPGQRTPDQFEVAINNPQEGQVMKYNATTEQWENGDDYHVYSTTERVVGKWIDGRPVYEKIIDIAQMPNNNIVSYPTNISNIGIVVEIKGITKGNGGSFVPIPLSNPDSSENIYINYLKTTNSIRIYTKLNYSAEGVYVTIRYTKTNDTV